MKKIKRILLLALCFSMLFLSLVSCGAKESESELLAIAKDLTEQSARVNEIVFGDGIALKKDGYSVGAYTEADEESLAFYGVTSVEDIKARLSAVYSEATAAWVVGTVLTSVKEQSQVLTYARYYDDKKMEGVNFVPVLMVRENHEQMAFGKASYADYVLQSSSRKEAVFTVDITVTDGKETKVFSDVRVTMVKEENGWRLDTTTYASLK